MVKGGKINKHQKEKIAGLLEISVDDELVVPDDQIHPRENARYASARRDCTEGDGGCVDI